MKTKISILAARLVMIACLLTSITLNAQSDLIGYWPFDGNGDDLSGNNLNLTLFGSPGFETGKFDQAIALDGTGNMYAQRPIDDEILDLNINDFTISIWVKYNSLEGEQVLIEKFSGSGGPGWTLTKVVWWGQQMHFYAEPAFWMVSDPLQITTNVWHNVVTCREGTVIKVYFNGALVTSGSGYGPIPDTYDPLLVGRRDYADGRVFGVNGMLDDIAIWSRCLTDNEISQLWNGGNGIPANTIGCNVTVEAGTDATSYFGIASMQQVTRTAVASGGTAPYTYSWTLGRPLLCNQVNGSGDEAFYGGTCTNNTCPESGSPAETASCSGNETITAILLDTAVICVTVTDANGCMATDCFTVNASDVRCFTGNGGNEKVKMCHHTNSNGNPWVEICVDINAIESHLAHGDYLGVCDFTKSTEAEIKTDVDLHFNLFPNPASRRVTLEFGSRSELPYIIEIANMTGRKLIGYQGEAIPGENTREIELAGIQRGIYLVELVLDGKQEVKKIVVE